MTAIEHAALELMQFFREKVAPEAAWDSGQEDDWPVCLSADNEEDSDELGRLMDTLEERLEEAGYDTKGPRGATP